MSMYAGATTVVRTVYGNNKYVLRWKLAYTKVLFWVHCYLWLSWKLYLENSWI